jgi:hypothetical protein
MRRRVTLSGHRTRETTVAATWAECGLRMRLPSWEWILFAAGLLLMLAIVFLVLTGRL